MFIESKNIIIIPTRKCGGQSVEAALRSFMHPNHTELYNLGTLSGHHPELTDSKYGTWTEDTAAHDIYVMTRNPFDKMVSNYFYSRKGTLIWKRRNLSFDDFVECVAYEKQTAHWKAHTRIQATEFATFNGVIIPHDTIRFETIGADFTRLTSKYNLSATLPHKNQSRQDTGQYREYYSGNSKNIVETLFEDDIRYYNYSF